jgi:uncharacterized repeat protein (TIGR03803 family)
MVTTSPRTTGNLLGITIALVLAFCPRAQGATNETVIHSFSTHDGQYSIAPLVEDAAGNFYGTTQGGGSSDRGAVFEIAAGTGAESVIYSFKGGKDGINPYGGLVLDAQGNLYGTTVTGGESTCYADGSTCGIVFELTPTANGWTETVIHRFQGGNDGGNPLCTLLLDSSGNLYGVTSFGGVNNGGTAFELSPSSGKWRETVLYSFGSYLDPRVGLVMDANSNLFGVGASTVFELSPGQHGWTEKNIYQFSEGGSLWGVVFDQHGNLFGSIYSSPTYQYGAVYELTPNGNSWQESTLYSFTGGTDGRYPWGSVNLDAAGNIYGATVVGGDLSCDSGGYGGVGCGVIFKLTRSGQETVLHTFASPSEGANPNGGLIFDSTGRLWGTTELNGPGGLFGVGVVFNLTPQNNGTWPETVVHGFASREDGEQPGSRLVADAAGDLFGTAEKGGGYNSGTVFELTRTGNAWKSQVIYSFKNGTDGAVPTGGLVFDSSGNLYGTTEYGGGFGSCHYQTGPIHCGTVFKLTHQSDGSWTESVLYGFKGKSDGALPLSGVVFDANGDLFGTTPKGGFKDQGTVFELTPTGSSWTESVIFSHGGHPVGILAIDSNGNLYGTLEGHFYQTNQGSIFELVHSQSGWTKKVLHTFTGRPDGSLPETGVVFDAVGNLFGTTFSGGSNGWGSVFKLTPNGNGAWQENVIHSFSGEADGALPTDLILDAAGNIYGTTAGGGGGGGQTCSGDEGCGVVYELSENNGWEQTLLYIFNGGDDGGYPAAGVLFGGDGNLYGTAEDGGGDGLGVIYEVTP